MPKASYHKQKTPDSRNQLPSTPKPQSSVIPSPSVTEHLEKTPTQNNRKRKLEERTDKARCQSRPSFTSTDRPSGLAPHPLIDPLVLVPATQEPDHVMEDPFIAESPLNNQPQDMDWSEEDRYYMCLNKIHTLLNDLHTELDNARIEGNLEFITKDSEIDEQLVKLATILPH